MGEGSVALTPVHYLVAQKNRHHGEAIIKGFSASIRNSDCGRLKRGALHLIGGLQFGSLELMQQAMAGGEPYIFFDRAYFGGGPGSGRLRATWGAFQQHWISERPGDRWAAMGIDLKPWHEGRQIMVVPPGPEVCRLFRLGDWLGETVARLKKATKRPIDVSWKGDRRPLSERLADCHCVVTWVSNVAVDAIIDGVPAFVSRHSAAAPVALPLDDLEERIEAPLRSAARETWARSLAWGQFTVEEIANGFAREVLLEPLRGSLG